MKLVVTDSLVYKNRPKLSDKEWFPWKEALLSGKYSQGKRFLCRGGRYCCLGVLCHIQNRPVASGYCVTRNNSTVEIIIFDHKSTALSMENPLENKLNCNGLFSGCYIEVNGKFYHSLAAMNDDDLSFEKIVEVIELVFR